MDLDDLQDTGKNCFQFFFSPLHARTMSVLRATPPFRPQSDGMELIGQDSDLWTSEQEEGPSSLQSQEASHDEDLQPIREEQMDPEVKIKFRGCSCVCSGVICITMEAKK